jgi:nucleotide-binding universal stress UspA family protein
VADKIIIAVDDRAESLDAVALADELARSGRYEIEAAAVLDYSPLPIDVEPYEVALREHFGRIFAALDRGRPHLRYAAHHLTGSSPPRELIALADELDAAMIVLGSTHRGPVGRVVPGSVGDRLLNGSPCPVAVAPRGYAAARNRLERIGVGFDGREEAESALALAVDLAAALDAELELLGVAAPPTSTVEQIAAPLGYEQAARGALASSLERAASALESTDVETTLLDGEPAAELAEASAALDLLVVGSRGYGPIRRALLGDVASRLMRTAACPTIVVPRGWRRPGARPAAAGDATAENAGREAS